MDALPEGFGAPIVCSDFDLHEALYRENVARMQREDEGFIPEGEEQDLDYPDHRDFANPPATAPPASDQPPSAPAAPLSAAAKRKQKKRAHDRAKRQQAAREAEATTVPPAPTPRVLKKAAACSAIEVVFSAAKFRASFPRWTGLPGIIDHPFLEYARDAEYLKNGMQYVDWRGEKTHVILDKHGHIIGVLVAPPLPSKAWAPVVEEATNAMRDARDKMSFPADAYHHRRAFDEGFPAEPTGFAFGGGRQQPGNVKGTSAHNASVMDEMLQNPAVRRMGTYPIPPFQALCHPIFADYHRTKRELLKKYPGLRRLFPRTPFTALTANFGPFSVSPPHVDQDNKADGMCLIGALGKFDADKGGHLVLWDFNLVIRFPPGCSILIPSAVVTHSNTPIQEGEERFSLIQYSAGGLFRWVANGFKSDAAWHAKATDADITRREEERQGRWATALKKFALWKDVKVGNYSGRSRVELYATGDAADLSDLTDLDSDGEDAEECPSPPKRIHCA